MTTCLIDQTILSFLTKGASLLDAQKDLQSKNINVDLEALKKRSKELKAKN